MMIPPICSRDGGNTERRFNRLEPRLLFDAEKDAVEVTAAVKKASERFLASDLRKRGIRL